MARTGALSENEIQTEMNKMVSWGWPQLSKHRSTQPVPLCLREPQTDVQVAFISQEAREKAREIQVKADEEFAIEKVGLYPCGLEERAEYQAKIVRQESQAIDAQYEKKRKQAEVGWKM